MFMFLGLASERGCKKNSDKTNDKSNKKKEMFSKSKIKSPLGQKSQLEYICCRFESYRYCLLMGSTNNTSNDL